MGRIGTILFAHRLGTALEPECKMYRLAADIFNDAAMVLDCLSPALPKTYRVMLLSLSSVLRALCGVAAGSSKASLSAHFATQGNLGELNAVSKIRLNMKMILREISERFKSRNHYITAWYASRECGCLICVLKMGNLDSHDLIVGYTSRNKLHGCTGCLYADPESATSQYRICTSDIQHRFTFYLMVGIRVQLSNDF